MKQRADGRWVKKITLSDGTVKYFYSNAKTERAATADFNKQVLEYEQNIVNKKTFESVALQWQLETFENLENNSLKVYKPACRECIEYFKGKMVQDITPSNVKNFVASYEAKGYSAKTIKNKLLVLNLIMKKAVIDQIISNNPCQLITVKTQAKRVKRQAITKAEIEKIKSNSASEFGFIALFLLYTGMRRGEAFALTPQDINFEEQTVHVSKTVEWLGSRPQIKNCPKTEAGNRIIPIPNILLPELLKRKNQKYLFQNYKGEIYDGSQITRGWNSYISEIGIKATPHMLRHTYATMLFDADIDVKTAQTWLGHTDIKTTLDIYTHLSEQHREVATQKWQDFLTTF